MERTFTSIGLYRKESGSSELMQFVNDIDSLFAQNKRREALEGARNTVIQDFYKEKMFSALLCKVGRCV